MLACMCIVCMLKPGGGVLCAVKKSAVACGWRGGRGGAGGPSVKTL